MRKLLWLFLASSLLWSCGYKEGIVQKAEISYLQFRGNTENARVQLDDGYVFMLQPGENNLYQIQPGKHSITIYKDSRLVAQKVLYVDSQATMEVEIP